MLRMIVKPAVRTRTVVSFLVALVVLGQTTSLLYHNARHIDELRRSIRHKRDVLAELQNLLTSIQDAENGQRGYLITSDETYLAPYYHATSAIDASLQKLSMLTASDGDEAGRVTVLRMHLQAKLSELQQTIELHRSRNPDKTRRVTLNAIGRREMSAVRNLIAAIQADQNRFVEDGRRDYEASLSKTNQLLALGIAVQFLLLVLVFVFFYRDILNRAQAAHEVQQANGRLTAILSTMGDGVCQVDRNGAVVYLNPAAEKTLGYKLHDVAGKNMHSLIHSHTPGGELCPPESCPLGGVIRGGDSYTTPEDWFQRQDGSFITVEYTGVALKSEHDVTGLVVSFRDITERRQREEQLRTTTELQQAILHGANVGIMSTRADGIITTFNAAAERMLQYRAEEVVDKITAAQFHDPEELSRHARELSRELDIPVAGGVETLTAKAGRLGLVDQAEWTYVRKDGSRFPVSASISPLRDAKGNVNGFLGIIEDITERKKAEAALRQSEARLKLALKREKDDARADFLTHVANRRAFYEAASTESTRARRYHRPLTLLYIDLDNFKQVNDSLGHDVGDELLVHVATTLRSNVRTTDVVARLGGDEFTLLLPETDHNAASVVAEKLRTRLLDSMQAKKWPVTFSIGLASFAPPPASVDEMIKRADEAMYSAKLRGKNSVVSALVATAR